MKKSILLIAIVTGLLVINSCSESLLDINPTNKYTEDIFWKSETQADAGLAACYQTLRATGVYGGGGWTTPLWEECATPNAMDYNSSSGFYRIGDGIHDASNTGIINNRWKHCYQGIGRCNSLIDKIAAITMNEDKKAMMVAESKFLRALFYGMLINYYGDVPLILEAPKLEHKSLPRTAKTEVFAQVIKDLDDAAAVLPVNAALPGKPTKGACYSLKAREYIYHGKIAEAAASAKQVMDMNKYSLYPNYRNLFMPEYENNQEVIFDVQYLYPNYTHSFDLIDRQYNTNAPLRNLVDAYLMSDGSKITESALYNATNYWENRDPRFRMTLVWPGSKYMGATVSTTRFAFTGYTFKKYSVYDEDNKYNTIILNDSQSDINYIVLRYADILLMYAEAKTELNQIDQSVYDAFNLVRTRAGMPGIQSTDPTKPTYIAMGDQDKMRQAIRLERRIEFAGEGFYYMDILRWRIAHIVNNGPIFTYNYTQKLVRKFDENRDYLWPVPSYETQENPNLNPNNPNW